MASSRSFLAMRMLVLLLLSLFQLRACSYSSPTSIQPLCHDDESYALLQFKESLAIDESASSHPSAYPKVASWKVEGESADCCSWDGVECNRDSGHVIGLDLGSSCLYGSIDSNSSLFHLVQLRRLNLADNNFNNSKIPYGIRNLSRLFDLDLSNSAFSGQIPTDILELSKLVSLDLRENSLKLQKPGLQNLVEALTNLEVLHLSGVNISAEIPQTMANLSSLSSLFLRGCRLHGEFPTGIFQLPNLRFLSIRYNPYLTGYLPEFQWGSRLEILMLAETNISGQLPESIGNIKSLKTFDAGKCCFSGRIPSSLGNLTKLNYLDLSRNSFSGKIPPSLVNLLQVSHLLLSFNNFSSGTLDWLGNLTKLNLVALSQTNSYGQIPSSIGNHTQLTSLELGGNKLHGPIPESIFRLPNLQILYLNNNFFSGTLKIDILFKPRNLVYLQLSSNILSLLNNHNDSIIMPKFKLLGLSECNLLGYFPSFLRSQNHLEFLELGNNKIEGHIPKWFMSLGTKTLWYLGLAGNHLTGFEQSLDVLPWNNLLILNLDSNKLQGSLPVPSSIHSYIVSNNQLTGKIPPIFCNLTSLVTLQLSNNNLNSMLPQCLGNVGNSALVLDLRNNSFSGDIPEAFSSGCELRVIDFSQNKLEGKIPRSLANCTKLEILNIEQNMVNDVFPSWLGIIPKLRVLILRSNGFYGVIGKPKTNIEFPSLQIVDLSNNSFWGKLPLEYFRTWTAMMKSVYKEHLTYMKANTSFKLPGYTMTEQYNFSMTMTNKGVMTLYERIQEILTAIDLSSNRFEGGIPDVLGDLKELYLLNLSNNFLTGHIPTSLGNLKKLETLDLSRNKLSGDIPVQLAQLTFLEVFNVSHNFLSGPIPQGNQFNTFDNTSFDANSGLCGKPLSKNCENGKDSWPVPKEDKVSGTPLEFGWKVVVIGYASGLVIGVILGCIMNKRKYEWLVKNYFARWQHKGQRLRSRLPRN